MLDLWISTYLFVYARIVIHKHSVGIAGGLGFNAPPPVHVYSLSFLSENLF